MDGRNLAPPFKQDLWHLQRRTPHRLFNIGRCCNPGGLHYTEFTNKKMTPEMLVRFRLNSVYLSVLLAARRFCCFLLAQLMCASDRALFSCSCCVSNCLPPLVPVLALSCVFSFALRLLLLFVLPALIDLVLVIVLPLMLSLSRLSW